ncbi:hypothetical protein M427DRAFT_388609 [Gonapodya prolifera JEL478]|uniref:PDEase domain-containing protein n=1 Tax=Gonapodya prolifera (strain JEL478) TaxID=1344416 RepID=A0A139A7Z0_GONPJ|nr:hypothetical protein M427DRAFT_388609 [Gonapodya prolifera JEL478]|eukprot:KXS12798.1 hypothetical protein M427DRAFT_388609 [Gonapodya prolifera JEL478]
MRGSEQQQQRGLRWEGKNGGDDGERSGSGRDGKARERGDGTGRRTGAERTADGRAVRGAEKSAVNAGRRSADGSGVQAESDSQDNTRALESALAHISTLSRHRIPHLARFLHSTSHSWMFDVFALAEFSDNNPLAALSLHVLLKRRLLQHFDIDVPKLVRFLEIIEHGYGDNPYHNHIHAADVLHSVDYIVASAQAAYAAHLSTQQHTVLPASANPHPGLTRSPSPSHSTHSTHSTHTHTSSTPLASPTPNLLPLAHNLLIATPSPARSPSPAPSCCSWLPLALPSTLRHTIGVASLSTTGAMRAQVAGALSGQTGPISGHTYETLETPIHHTDIPTSSLPLLPSSSSSSLSFAPSASALPTTATPPTPTPTPFTPSVLLALLLAAICHDFDHPGCTASYILRASDPRVPRPPRSDDDKSRDPFESPLERHHARKAGEVLERAGCNVSFNGRMGVPGR